MAKKQNGFSLIELLIVVAIILIIAAIAIPNLLRSKQAANEAAAVAVLRGVHTSQAVYIVQFTSSIGYADNLVKLGPGAPCDINHACLSDEMIGCTAQPCKKSGFLFYLTSSATALPILDYTSSATPIQWAQTGSQNYCTNDDGTIRAQKAPTSSNSGAVIHTDCADPAQYVPVGG
jgi:prepilin-type N-terminal cleavage/methylation domain-containing protein